MKIKMPRLLHATVTEICLSEAAEYLTPHKKLFLGDWWIAVSEEVTVKLGDQVIVKDRKRVCINGVWHPIVPRAVREVPVLLTQLFGPAIFCAHLSFIIALTIYTVSFLSRSLDEGLLGVGMFGPVFRAGMPWCLLGWSLVAMFPAIFRMVYFEKGSGRIPDVTSEGSWR